MKTCGHVVLYALDFAKQCVPVRPDGCLICEKDELESKLDGQSKLLKLIHDDLLLRAEVYPPSPGRADRVVNLSATLWNRLCDAVEPPK